MKMDILLQRISTSERLFDVLQDKQAKKKKRWKISGDNVNDGVENVSGRFAALQTCILKNIYLDTVMHVD